MMPRCLVVATLAVMMTAPRTSCTQDTEELAGSLFQIVTQYMNGCYVVLMTTALYSDLLANLNRRLKDNYVQTARASLHNIAPEVLFGDQSTTCRGLVLHLTNTNNSHELSALEKAALWKLPEMKVIVVGNRMEMKATLLHSTFRNTIHGIYLALHHHSKIITLDPGPYVKAVFRLLKKKGQQVERVSIYRKCLYCDDGKASVNLIQSNLGSLDNLFDDRQFLDLRGHIFRVVTLKHFPFMDYKEEDEGLTVLDSIDTRFLNTFATVLNITFHIHVQKEGKWGIPSHGRFNGMMGEVQREEVDFCTISAPTPERLEALDYVRGYPSDVLILTSLKPTVLPENMALVRPLEDEVWIALIASLFLWSMAIWILEKTVLYAMKGHGVQLDTAILTAWGSLVEQPPRYPSICTSGQMLVGWWLLFCLIVDTGYRSSLVSHLAVKSRTDTIEKFEDLVVQPGWKWGAMGWALSGAPLEFFIKHTDPVVQRVYKEMKLLDTVDGALRRVLAGGFSFISFSNYVKVAVASNYADAFGNSPFHLSREGVPVMAVFGWPVRSGAPFQSRFRHLMSRLEDGGITSFWKDEVIARRVQENRAYTSASQNKDSPRKAVKMDQQLESLERLVLGISHLQGAFYVLMIGSGLAVLTLLGEKRQIANCQRKY